MFRVRNPLKLMINPQSLFPVWRRTVRPSNQQKSLSIKGTNPFQFKLMLLSFLLFKIFFLLLLCFIYLLLCLRCSCSPANVCCLVLFSDRFIILAAFSSKLTKRHWVVSCSWFVGEWQTVCQQRKLSHLNQPWILISPNQFAHWVF